MMLYHFLSEEFSLKVLKEKRLKVSRLNELNDPFEFLGVDLSDKQFRIGMTTTRNILSSKNGLLCFSESWSSPVMWAHYASRHRGICLGFEVGDGVAEKVKYREERVPKPAVLNEQFVEGLLFSKFKHWEYEEEWRVYVRLQEQEQGIYYVNFNEKLTLRTVIVGCESRFTRSQISEVLGPTTGQVVVFKARPGFTKFKVVRNQDESMWA